MANSADEVPALDRYRRNAERLGARFLGLSSEYVLRSVATFIPTEPAHILDVGAGSGRDALWFARHGHNVTAVEPVEEMSDQAEGLPGSEKVEWISDHLPLLEHLKDRAGRYDFCLLSGVWHHVPDVHRSTALSTLVKLLGSGGYLAMSLRLGSDTDGKTNFYIDIEDPIALAERVGLLLRHRARTQSNQPANIAAGVEWEWLVFEKRAGNAT